MQGKQCTGRGGGVRQVCQSATLNSVEAGCG
jgi:hypothetical protein